MPHTCTLISGWELLSPYSEEAELRETRASPLALRLPVYSCF